MEQTEVMIHGRSAGCHQEGTCILRGKGCSAIPKKFRVTSYIWSRAAAKILHCYKLSFMRLDCGPRKETGEEWDRNRTANLFQLCISPIFYIFFYSRGWLELCRHRINVKIHSSTSVFRSKVCFKWAVTPACPVTAVQLTASTGRQKHL